MGHAGRGQRDLRGEVGLVEVAEVGAPVQQGGAALGVEVEDEADAGSAQVQVALAHGEVSGWVAGRWRWGHDG